MSYEKIQNISIKKDRTITINSASSNVYPTTYYTSTIENKDEKEYLETLKGIFSSLMGGSYKFNFSSTSKVRLAFNRAMVRIKDEYPDLTSWDFYLLDVDEENFYERGWVRKDLEEIEKKINRPLTYEVAEEITLNIFRIFLEELEKAQKEKNISRKNYYIIMKEGPLISLTKYGYKYATYGKGNKFNESQALEVKEDYPSSKNIKIEDWIKSNLKIYHIRFRIEKLKRTCNLIFSTKEVKYKKRRGENMKTEKQMLVFLSNIVADKILKDHLFLTGQNISSTNYDKIFTFGNLEGNNYALVLKNKDNNIEVQFGKLKNNHAFEFEEVTCLAKYIKHNENYFTKEEMEKIQDTIDYRERFSKKTNKNHEFKVGKLNIRGLKKTKEEIRIVRTKKGYDVFRGDKFFKTIFF